MKTIPLRQIVQNKGIDQDILARTLFPKAKHPKMALQRVMAGESQLDEDQIRGLSKLSGLTISEIFSEAEWKSKTSGNIHMFENAEYKAELNTESWITKLWHKTELIYEEVIHSGSIPLSTYIESLNQIINNHKNN